MNFNDKITQLRQEIDRQLRPLITNDYVLLNLPYHGNIGDTLIWQGEIDYLSTFPYKCLGAHSENSWRGQCLRPEAVILLHGGGNFGDLWRDFHEFSLRIIEDYPDNKIIMFPQSVWYNDKNLLANDAQLINRHSNLTLCARDRYTYDIYRANFTNATVLLVPDMAFCISESTLAPYRLKTVAGKKLFFKRTDKELATGDLITPDPHTDIREWPTIEKKTAALNMMRIARGIKHRLPVKPLANTINVVTDVFANRYLRKNLVNTGCRFLAPYEHVTTTRLHAMILSILLHKPVRYIDNTTGKLSAFAQTWLSDLDAIKPYHK